MPQSAAPVDNEAWLLRESATLGRVGRHREPLTGELRVLSDRLHALAATQGGVVSAAQAHVLGADDAHIRRLRNSGEWRGIRRGVYADALIPPREDSGHLRRCAAVLAGLQGDAVVSHVSAARLLGLPLPPRVDPCVSLTRRRPAPTRGPRSAGGIDVAVHLGDYDEADVVQVYGVPVLAGARLVLDCCATMPPDSALAVADTALFRRLTTRDRMQEELLRRRGRPGTPIARLVVERADPGGRNWFESSSRWWLLEAGLPRPELQVCFSDERGTVRAEVDMWFAGKRTVGEADGAGKYAEPGALFAEKQREDWLRDSHQVEVVRWIPREMRTGAGREQVVARFERAFGRRR
jgi:Transcriptional regulator, AbiEi antitoxin